MPASGKTTLARELARAFDLPLLDKDDILEALFEGLGVGDLAWRQRLSRASDRVLMRLAEQSRGAVLTSFWRHPGADGDAGTPTDGLAGLAATIVEVHCVCPPDLAARRFRERVRHPGHLDDQRSGDVLEEKLRQTAERGPLGLGPTVTVDTSGGYDVATVIKAVRTAFEGP